MKSRPASAKILPQRKAPPVKSESDRQGARDFFAKQGALSPELVQKGFSLLPLTRALMPDILAREGYGPAKSDPRDSGGLTRFGVAQNYNAEGLAMVGKKSVADLTPGEAALIFQEKYLKKTGLDKLKSYPLAAFLYDTAINPGPSFMPSAVRRALGIAPNAKPLGDAEAALLNRLSPQEQEALMRRLNSEKVSYRTSQIQKNPKLDVFRKGWMDRYDDALKRSQEDLRAGLVIPRDETSPPPAMAAAEPIPESVPAQAPSLEQEQALRLATQAEPPPDTSRSPA